tara:strand:+ start:423 stop:869 length:447 start_codon:yes stop_codon:yes gene_type:complete
VSKRSRKKNKRLKKRKKIKKKKSIKKNRKKIRSSKSRKTSRKTPVSKDDDGGLVIGVSDNWSKQAYVNKSKYQKKYSLSIKENEKFWKKEGKRINWIKPYSKIKDVTYSKEEVRIKWFYDGTLNASENCIDRHLKKKWKEDCNNLGWR